MKFRPKAYVTRQLPQKGIDTLLKSYDVAIWDSPEPVPRQELMLNIPGTSALMCMCSDKIDKQVLDRAGPSLKVIGTLSRETDHIDVPECERRGIHVITLNPINVDVYVNFVVATLLQAYHQCSADSIRVRSSSNPEVDLTSANPEVDVNANNVPFQGLTLGVFGFGRLGKALTTSLKDMGVNRVLYNDIEIKPDCVTQGEHTSANDLLEQSDIVCVCCRRTKTGFRLDKNSFKQMKKGAILIDATEGHVINYADLYQALRDEQISAAGLAMRTLGCDPKYKDPLLGLNNCHVFPYQEANHNWDHRNHFSVQMANELLQVLDCNQDNRLQH